MKTPKVIRRLRAATIVAGAAALGSAFYADLVVVTHTVHTTKLQVGQDFRIALLSDLHSNRFGRGQQKLLERLRQAKPDMVAMTGDMFDDIVPMDGMLELLEGLREQETPVYYATGNHEYRTGNMDALLDILRRYGVHILRDGTESCMLGGAPVLLSGGDDPERELHDDHYSFAVSYREAFGGLPTQDDRYHILLAHRPELIREYLYFPFDLILNGHAHGGQIRVPFLLENGVYAAGQGFFPQHTSGVYHHGQAVQIVSRGMSFRPLVPRVFNPPELVLIDVKGASVPA